MPGLLNPQFWNGIGVVTLVVLIGVMLLVSLQRGWLILGIHHREVIAGRDREIAARDKTIDALDARCDRQDDTIGLQAKAISDTTAVEEFAKTILTAMREGQRS
ncbi:hypothetical protein [Mycolicibacterium sphagni]|uniref:Uncharacterized protein n=1 Tax=Mycolicibacterium sphagni TaxID=1786 RepID=A0A255DLT1_9MYCO|nr:hypothetical protein [Mycolicibacterium sphagni]OYN80407.1 hypothetical protein CG716_09755 [Mycolicibacterium sphagni]